MNKICIILAGLLLAIANAGAVTIKGKTNLNSGYSIILEYINVEKNETTVKIPIKADGSFEKEFTVKYNTIIEWNIIKNDGMRQMPAGCYFYAKNSEVIEFSYMLNKGSREHPLSLNITYSDKLSKENKLLFDYYICNYLSPINKKVEKVKTKRQLLKDNKVRSKDISDLLDFLTIRSKFSYRYKGIITEEDRKEILRMFNSQFTYKIKVGYGWNALLTTLYGKAKTISTLENLSEVLKRITNDFTDIKKVDILAKSTIDIFLERYKLAGDFATELNKFKKAVSPVTNESTKKYLINSFKQMQYTVIGADMPDVTLVDAKGNTVKLTDFKGQYIYLDLWFVG